MMGALVGLIAACWLILFGFFFVASVQFGTWPERLLTGAILVGPFVAMWVQFWLEDRPVPPCPHDDRSQIPADPDPGTRWLCIDCGRRWTDPVEINR